MTLANLKKRGPSVKPKSVDIEQFINGALHYANGCDNVVNLPLPETQECETSHFRRATFTLGEKAIKQLDSLSMQTGVAKSRLIRIWLDEQQKSGTIQAYLLNSTK